MSNWTHVAGIVRVDTIRCVFGEVDFEKIFGRECLFESSAATWKEADEHPEKFLPMGGEGTLQMSVWVNPDESHVAAYTVSIFGDLRGHDSADEIIDWFKKKCEYINENREGNALWLRNACIVANNEMNGQKSWAFERE